jgi:hypothetical protein
MTLDAQLKFILLHEELLNDWQCDFANNLLNFDYYSPRQQEKLAEVVDCVRRKLAAAQLKNPVGAKCAVKAEDGTWYFAVVEKVIGREVTVCRADGVRLYGSIDDRDLRILD